MTKYRAVLTVVVTYAAKSFEDAELGLDNNLNLRKLFEDKGMEVERVGTDIFKVGPAKQGS